MVANQGKTMKLINKTLLVLSLLGLTTFAHSASSNEEAEAILSLIDQKISELNGTCALLSELDQEKWGSSRQTARRFIDSTIQRLHTWNYTLREKELANYYNIHKLSQTLEAYHTALQQLQTPLQTSTGRFSGNSNQQRNADLILRMRKLGNHINTLEALNKEAAYAQQKDPDSRDPQLIEIKEFIRHFAHKEDLPEIYEELFTTDSVSQPSFSVKEYLQNPHITETQKERLSQIAEEIANYVEQNRNALFQGDF
jgi:hypothetical protein